MIQLEQIKHIEFELSSFCNATCPMCPRNVYGNNKKLGYIQRNLTMGELTEIVEPIKHQLTHVRFEGNFGDPLANPDVIPMIEYLGVPVTIVTNGYFRDEKFWQQLGKLDVEVQFGLDGIDNTTHTRYRRGTNYDRIIHNAVTFIRHGGKAVWKMIKFDFNIEQIDLAKTLSEKLGFYKFLCIDHGRNSAPVFDQAGNLVDIIGEWRGHTDFDTICEQIDNGEVLLEDIYKPSVQSIHCQTVRNSSIYVSSTGEVYPCCYTGFSPATYGKGRWHQPVNQQLLPLIQDNNALVHGLEHAVKWFSNISLQPGDLVVCDSSCGRNQ